MDEEHFWGEFGLCRAKPARAGLADYWDGWRWPSTRAQPACAGSGLLDLVRWREQHPPES